MIPFQRLESENVHIPLSQSHPPVILWSPICHRLVTCLSPICRPSLQQKNPVDMQKNMAYDIETG